MKIKETKLSKYMNIIDIIMIKKIDIYTPDSEYAHINGKEIKGYTEFDLLYDIPYMIENDIVVSGLEYWIDEEIFDNKEMLRKIYKNYNNIVKSL